MNNLERYIKYKYRKTRCESYGNVPVELNRERFKEMNGRYPNTLQESLEFIFMHGTNFPVIGLASNYKQFGKKDVRRYNLETYPEQKGIIESMYNDHMDKIISLI